MKKSKKLSILLIIFTITLALTCFAKAQTSTVNMQTFFDSEVTGMKIQVNATVEAQPAQNITVTMKLTAKDDVTTVSVASLNLSIFGFLNGTSKTLLTSMTDGNFQLNQGESKEYNLTFTVLEQVWDTTYGEILLMHSAKYGIVTITPDEPLTLGFTVTHVKNVYVESLEDNFRSLNETYWQLKQNYTALQGSVSDLDNTRAAVGVLAVTTVFFVATTIYMVMRRPKDYW